MVKKKRFKIPRVNRAEQEFAFHCKTYRLPQVIAQFPYALSMQRRFTADFCFPVQRLLIEINGGIWIRGAHGHPIGISNDLEKMQYAALLGYTVLPFSPEQVMSCYAVRLTIRVLHKLGWRSPDGQYSNGTSASGDLLGSSGVADSIAGRGAGEVDRGSGA